MYGFLLVFFSNSVPKTRRFLRYSICKYTLTLKPGLGSLKVIKNYTVRSDAHDFLLTFHSNHRPILHRFRDKRRFPSKIAKFSYPLVFYAPDEGVSLRIWYRRKCGKSFYDGAIPSVEKLLR